MLDLQPESIPTGGLPESGEILRGITFACVTVRLNLLANISHGLIGRCRRSCAEIDDGGPLLIAGLRSNIKQIPSLQTQLIIDLGVMGNRKPSFKQRGVLLLSLAGGMTVTRSERQRVLDRKST